VIRCLLGLRCVIMSISHLVFVVPANRTLSLIRVKQAKRKKVLVGS